MRTGKFKITTVLALTFVFKLLLLLLFIIIYLGMLDNERIPVFIDQEIYIHDIRMIRHEFYNLFASDDLFEANNTLYSRVAGLLGSVLFMFDAPLIPALFLNLMLHVGYAYFMLKIYQFLDGGKPSILFLLIAFSPTLTAYTMFALRDTMIVFVCSAYLYYLLQKKYLFTLLLAPVFLFLRPLMTGFVLFFISVFIGIDKYVKTRYKKLYLLVLVPALLGLAYLTLDAMDLLWILNLTSKDEFTWEKFIASTLGYGVFVGEIGTNLGEESTGKMLRFVMLDSVLLMPLWVLATVYLVRRGDLTQKRFAWLVLLLILAFSISYQSIQGNYPFRKLLPLFPAIITVTFIGVEKYLIDRKSRNY